MTISVNLTKILLHYRNKDKLNEKVLRTAAAYLGCHQDNVALNSTTEGLSLVYIGIQLLPGTEVLTSIHDHYASDRILFFKAKHSQVTIKKIKLYESPAEATEQEIVKNIKENISSQTRLLALKEEGAIFLLVPLNNKGLESAYLTLREQAPLKTYFSCYQVPENRFYPGLYENLLEKYNFSKAIYVREAIEREFFDKQS